jgi:hypothetical protein
MELPEAWRQDLPACTRQPGGVTDAATLLASAAWRYDASNPNGYRLGNGGTVLAWRDRTQNHVDAVATMLAAGTKGLVPLAGSSTDWPLPRLVPRAINGHDAVRFLSGAALHVEKRDWGQRFTVAVVVKPLGRQRGRYARIFHIAAGFMLAGPDHETGTYGIYLNPFPLPTTGHAFGTGGLGVIAWSYDAGCELVLLNGAVVLDARIKGTPVADGAIGIGNLLLNPHPSYWFEGDIGEVVFFARALSRDELFALSDDLGKRWDVPQFASPTASAPPDAPKHEGPRPGNLPERGPSF